MADLVGELSEIGGKVLFAVIECREGSLDSAFWVLVAESGFSEFNEGGGRVDGEFLVDFGVGHDELQGVTFQLASCVADLAVFVDESVGVDGQFVPYSYEESW